MNALRFVVVVVGAALTACQAGPSAPDPQSSPTDPAPEVADASAAPDLPLAEPQPAPDQTCGELGAMAPADQCLVCVKALEGAGLSWATRECDDGLPCTSDRCEPASGCEHASSGLCECEQDADCADLDDVCHVGRCDDLSWTCGAEVSVGAECDDGVACTEWDACQLDGSCRGDWDEALAGCECQVDAECDDGNPCTDDTCLIGTGCVSTDNAAPCVDGMCVAGSCEPECVAAGGCKTVDGKLIFKVVMSVLGETGHKVCERYGLTCAGVPVFEPPAAACLAFHPGAAVTTDFNGWAQGIYCDDNEGLACEGTTSCHDCPECTTSLNCGTAASSLIEEIYVECVP